MTFIGMQEGISTPSSMMLMRVPGYEGPEGSLMVFADCGVAIAPDAGELADIALATAHTVRLLLGWEPRVAMLSFSTKGSGGTRVGRPRPSRPCAWCKSETRTSWSTASCRWTRPSCPRWRRRKVPGDSPVAGRANILIFPDLNAGNIACKCVQRFAKADAFGPFLQGFAKTVSDLSRGAIRGSTWSAPASWPASTPRD